eukprot:COSAG01_NODE_48155_length_383_cov_3.278169_1_plen_59_part_10
MQASLIARSHAAAGRWLPACCWRPLYSHDGEGLLAGTALSQPKAGSQPAAARRAQPLAA